VPHKLRTAAEPRQNTLYNVRLSHIEEVNPTVRLLHLAIPSRVQTIEEQDQNDEEVFLLCISFVYFFCIFLSLFQTCSPRLGQLLSVIELQASARPYYLIHYKYCTGPYCMEADAPTNLSPLLFPPVNG
jgi:hypothetical protein